MEIGGPTPAMVSSVVFNSSAPPGKALVDADGHIWHLNWSKSTEGSWYYEYKGRAPGPFAVVTKESHEDPRPM